MPPFVCSHLIFEIEEAGELSALVVSSQHEERLGVGELERVEVENNFGREAAAIHVVAEEQIARRRRVTANLEQSNQIEELPVDVTAH